MRWTNKSSEKLSHQVHIEFLDLLHPCLVRANPGHVELGELDGSLAQLPGAVEVADGQQLDHVLSAQLGHHLLLGQLLETRHLVLVAQLEEGDRVLGKDLLVQLGRVDELHEGSSNLGGDVHVHLALHGLLVLLVPDHGFEDRGGTRQNDLVARNRLVITEKSEVSVVHLLVNVLKNISSAVLSSSCPVTSCTGRDFDLLALQLDLDQEQKIVTFLTSFLESTVTDHLSISSTLVSSKLHLVTLVPCQHHRFSRVGRNGLQLKTNVGQQNGLSCSC